MAVSITEAWNDVVFTQTNMLGKNLVESTSAKVASKISDIEDQPINKKENEFMEKQIYHLNSILLEFQDMKKEQTKRFTIQLVIFAIFVAVMFLYIDMLQNKVKNLNMNFHRHQLMNMHKIQYEPVLQFAEQYPWLQ